MLGAQSPRTMFECLMTFPLLRMRLHSLRLFHAVRQPWYAIKIETFVLEVLALRNLNVSEGLPKANTVPALILYIYSEYHCSAMFLLQVLLEAK